MIEYVYVPLSGNAYITTDICDSFEVVKMNDREIRLELRHSAKNTQGNDVKFHSNIIIPVQKLTPTKLSADLNKAIGELRDWQIS